jgi:hypothetical protein
MNRAQRANFQVRDSLLFQGVSRGCWWWKSDDKNGERDERTEEKARGEGAGDREQEMAQNCEAKKGEEEDEPEHNESRDHHQDPNAADKRESQRFVKQNFSGSVRHFCQDSMDFSASLFKDIFYSAEFRGTRILASGVCEIPVWCETISDDIPEQQFFLFLDETNPVHGRSFRTNFQQFKAVDRARALANPSSARTNRGRDSGFVV